MNKEVAGELKDLRNDILYLRRALNNQMDSSLNLLERVSALECRKPEFTLFDCPACGHKTLAEDITPPIEQAVKHDGFCSCVVTFNASVPVKRCLTCGGVFRKQDGWEKVEKPDTKRGFRG